MIYRGRQAEGSCVMHSTMSLICVASRTAPQQMPRHIPAPQLRYDHWDNSLWMPKANSVSKMPKQLSGGKAPDIVEAKIYAGQDRMGCGELSHAAWGTTNWEREYRSLAPLEHLSERVTWEASGCTIFRMNKLKQFLLQTRVWCNIKGHWTLSWTIPTKGATQLISFALILLEK